MIILTLSVSGLSAVAACAPSEKFLNMGGVLGAGLGVVFVASLGECCSNDQVIPRNVTFLNLLLCRIRGQFHEKVNQEVEFLTG